MQSFNQEFADNGLEIRFVSLVRDDLFDFMKGSNTGKIKSDSFIVSWKEKDFASLLIKRMNVFENEMESALEDPVVNLKKWFPDEIFSSFLNNFETNRYSCNFYAYMAAISFNRPRDYLQFCYAMRDRLSMKRPATSENIESAEVEYTDYLQLELRTELYLVSRIFDYDLSENSLNLLINKMIEKDIFGYAEFKICLSKFFSEKRVSNKKIEMLLTELWRYGVIGVKEKKDKIIRFKYLSSHAIFNMEKIKKYKFYLHRGLWWFAKKNKK
ncbi:hypothetical protein HN747_03210 [archaeon]|jgi:hypothetical protein|nr:hypothetical protein [archaeon]